MENKAFLIDTQIFIWWMENNRRLRRDLFVLLNDSANSIFLSVATVWEIIIKTGKKKLKVPMDLESGIKKSGFQLLPIEITHVLEMEKLPLHHRDPFDRILISQAITERLALITSDEKIWKYKLSIVKV